MRSTTGCADSKQIFGVMYTRRCTRTHRGRGRESGGSSWLLELLRCQRWLARLWVRAALVGGASLPSSLGSRSRCQDGCSHQQTAFPLHLGSPRQKEIVLPHQCKRCLPSCRRAPPSRAAQLKNRSSGSHHFLQPQRCESQTQKGEKKYLKKWEQ